MQWATYLVVAFQTMMMNIILLKKVNTLKLQQEPLFIMSIKCLLSFCSVYKMCTKKPSYNLGHLKLLNFFNDANID